MKVNFLISSVAIASLCMAMGARAQQPEPSAMELAKDEPPPGDMVKDSGSVGVDKVLPANASGSVVSTRMEHFREKLDRLDQVSRNETRGIQDDMRSRISDLRKKADQAVEQGNKLDKANADQAQKIRIDLQRAFDDMDRRYREAVTKLSQDGRTKLEAAE